MVTSHIDGRIRLRSASLRDPDAARKAEAALTQKSGVRRATANPRTGSMLVEYDSGALTRDDVVEAAGLPAKEDAQIAAPKRRRTKAENMRIAKRGMLASGFAMLVFAAADRERAHILAGGAFLVFNAYHLYTYRRRLLA